jgi:hypothetical protein
MEGQGEFNVTFNNTETDIGIKNLEVRFFGQWTQDGANYFEVNDTGRGWDGTFRGQPMNADVYLWRVEAEYPDGEQQAFQGQTTLIR